MPSPSYAEIRDFIVSAAPNAAARAAAGGVDDLHLLNAGVVDSLGFVNLLAAIEERFGIEIDLGDADPDEFLTVGGLARCAAAVARGDGAAHGG